MQRLKSLPLLGVLVLALAPFFGGCNSAVRPDSVTVSVADLKPASSSSTETRVIVTLRFTSESLNAFGFSGSVHKLYLNGGYVGRAVSEKALGLPPLSTATQDVTMVFENSALVHQLLANGAQSTVRYRLDSVLHTKSGDDEMKVKSSYEGTIDLAALQSGSR